MKEQFDPIKGQRGEFRVALNLSELGDRAWEILSLSQSLGFPPPQFRSYARLSGVTEFWAVILQQFHRYDVDPRTVVEPWDDQMRQLWQEIGEDAHLKIVILHNFAEYLEPAATAC